MCFQGSGPFIIVIIIKFRDFSLLLLYCFDLVKLLFGNKNLYANVVMLAAGLQRKLPPKKRKITRLSNIENVKITGTDRHKNNQRNREIESLN